MDEEILQNNLGDFVIRGAGEMAMLSLVTGHDPLSIYGLSYISKGKVIKNPPDIYYNINDFPQIDYSFIPDEYMANLKETFNYFSSRGCPFNCSYCVASEMYNRKWHNKNEDKVAEELAEAYKKYYFKSVFFWDDNLFVDVKRLKSILERLNGLNIHFKWRGFCRTDIFEKICDDEIIQLKQSGLEWLSFGAESGSQDMLNKLNKGITVSSIKEAALKLKRLDIAADFSFMGGMPGEGEGDFYKTLDLLNWITIHNQNIYIRLFKFVPYPHMPILKENEKIAGCLPQDIHQWSNVTYQNARFRWISRKINDILNVFSASSMYPEKTARFSLVTILYYITKFRFKKRFFFFPIESFIVNKIHNMLMNYNHRKFTKTLEVDIRRGAAINN